MRLLSFIRKCKIKSLFLCYRLPRRLISGTAAPADIATKCTEDTSLVEIAPTWPADEEPELRAAVLRDMRVLPAFVTEQEESSLLAELEPYLKRMRYEFDHWDNAIQGYRETERSSWRPENEAVIARVKEAAFTDSVAGETLPHAHVLDLAAAGHIKPHVDAVRFCGDVIAGVCLLSDAVMRLQHCQKEHLVLHALLPRRGLYIMRGVARYEFSHAVPGGAESEFCGRRVRRARRLALICRSRPAPH